VWHYTLGEPTKIVCYAVQPFIFFGSTYKLRVFITFSDDGVNDGVCGVQLGSSVGDLSCENFHVMMDDGMGFAWALIVMVGVLCW
jgi:hypothetical protein